MKHWKKYAAIFASCLCLSTSVTAASGFAVIIAEAHSGRTDANGGHRDTKNKSGLGSYHYHCGGYPAHLHKNGVCPYTSAARSSTSGQSKGTAPAASEETMKTYQAVFQADYYYAAYPDLQTAIGNDSKKLFEHFLQSGMAEGRRGCESFDAAAYRANNPDLDEAFGEDWKQYYEHYISTGCHENRVCR